MVRWMPGRSLTKDDGRIQRLGQKPASRIAVFGFINKEEKRESTTHLYEMPGRSAGD